MPVFDMGRRFMAFSDAFQDSALWVGDPTKGYNIHVSEFAKWPEVLLGVQNRHWAVARLFHVTKVNRNQLKLTEDFHLIKDSTHVEAPSLTDQEAVELRRRWAAQWGGQRYVIGADVAEEAIE